MERQSPRLPKNYALLREIVHQAGRGTHQSASEIYRIARERQPTIGLATVHRGLGRLCELGEIMKIDVPSGQAAWYESPAPAHAHLSCGRCGALVDIDYATSKRALRSIAERDGVRIADAAVTFRGLCRPCAAAEERRAARLRR